MHGHIAEYRIDIVFERRVPLRGMLAVAPSRLMSGDVAFRAVLEGDRFRRTKLRRQSGRLANLDRIESIETPGRPYALI